MDDYRVITDPARDVVPVLDTGWPHVATSATRLFIPRIRICKLSADLGIRSATGVGPGEVIYLI